MSDRLELQLSFIREAEKLKTVQRRNRTLDSRFENSAEHSWHVALLALVTEEHATSNVDLLRVLKMLLIHDLVEIYAGDTWLYDTENEEERQISERKAAKELFSLLPEDQHNDLYQVWEEFEACSSDEAIFARSVDALQPLINHLQTAVPTSDAERPARSAVLQRKKMIANSSVSLWELAQALIEDSTAKGLYRDE